MPLRSPFSFFRALQFRGPDCQMQFRRLRPRRGLSTSRSTMPLINNNSAHIRGDSQTQRWGSRIGEQLRRKRRASFAPVDAGSAAAGSALRFLPAPCPPPPLPLSLCCCTPPGPSETVHWKINTVGIFVGHVASDTRDAHPLRRVAIVSSLMQHQLQHREIYLSFSCSDTIIPRSITIELHDRARTVRNGNGRALELGN